jgi:hypothetical protein
MGYEWSRVRDGLLPLLCNSIESSRRRRSAGDPDTDTNDYADPIADAGSDICSDP